MTPATRDTGTIHAAEYAETSGEVVAAFQAAMWLEVTCERHRVMRWGKRKEAK